LRFFPFGDTCFVFEGHECLALADAIAITFSVGRRTQVDFMVRLKRKSRQWGDAKY
jgi:hypothetical protein